MARTRVIIVSFKSDNDLKRCLPTLISENKIEIVIVDNADSDSTRKLLENEFPLCTYINAGSNLGFAKANNLGSQGFTGEFLLFLNPDTEVEEGAVNKLADFLADKKEAGAAGPLVRNRDGSRQMSYRRWPGFTTSLFHRYSLITRLWSKNPWSKAYLMSDDDGTKARPVDWLSACCLLLKRTAFEQVGGFDKRYFMFCEDTALCKTLELKGFARWYVPEAVITHHLGKSAGEKSISLVYQRHRSMWLYFTTFNRFWPLLAPFTLLGLAIRFSIYALRVKLQKHNT